MGKIGLFGGLLWVMVGFASISWGAIDRTFAPTNKKHRYIEDGTTIGGEAGGTSYTLLNIRRILAPKDKIERVILDLGDENGKPLKNKMSYFQASIDKKNPRVVIDLSQMRASAVDAQKIKKIFSSSPYVKSAKINFDPVDGAITLQLNLNHQLQMEVFKLQGKKTASRIVIDLKNKG